MNKKLVYGLLIVAAGLFLIFAGREDKVINEHLPSVIAKPTVEEVMLSMLPVADENAHSAVFVNMNMDITMDAFNTICDILVITDDYGYMEYYLEDVRESTQSFQELVSAFAFSVALDTKDETAAAYLLFAIKDEHKEEVVSVVKEGMLEQHSLMFIEGGLRPLSLDFPGVTPVGVTTANGYEVALALADTEQGLVLVSVAPAENIDNVFSQKYVHPEKNVVGDNYLRLKLSKNSEDLGYFEKLGYPMVDDLLMDFSVYMPDDSTYRLETWTNAYSSIKNLGEGAFLNMLDLAKNTELSVPSFLGGPVLAYSTVPGLISSDATEEYLYDLVDDYEFEEAIETIMKFGFTWEEIRSALSNRISFVLGGVSVYPLLGHMPGAYLTFEGVTPEMGDKINVLATMTLGNQMASFSPINVDKWNGFTFSNSGVNFMGVMGENGYSFGILNQRTLTTPLDASSRMLDFMSKPTFISFFADMEKISSIASDIQDRLEFLMDEDMEKGFEVFYRLTENISTIEGAVDSIKTQKDFEKSITDIRLKK